MGWGLGFWRGSVRVFEEYDLSRVFFSENGVSRGFFIGPFIGVMEFLPRFGSKNLKFPEFWVEWWGRGWAFIGDPRTWPLYL